MTVENILEMYSEDEYKELCAQADFFGMESLTEEEQIVVMYYNK